MNVEVTGSGEILQEAGVLAVAVEEEDAVEADVVADDK